MVSVVIRVVTSTGENGGFIKDDVARFDYLPQVRQDGHSISFRNIGVSDEATGHRLPVELALESLVFNVDHRQASPGPQVVDLGFYSGPKFFR